MEQRIKKRKRKRGRRKEITGKVYVKGAFLLA
jgi:hypothetical protein